MPNPWDGFKIITETQDFVIAEDHEGNERVYLKGYTFRDNFRARSDGTIERWITVEYD